MRAIGTCCISPQLLHSMCNPKREIAILTYPLDIRGGTGPATSLFINDKTPKPSPGTHECLIRVRAFGLNRGDIVQRQGLYPMPPTAPKTLGLEFAGVISVVGDGNDKTWKVGAEVFGLVYGGAYAEFVVADKRLLMAKPAELSWESAGSITEVCLLLSDHSIFLYNPIGGS
jgi:NADPH:quinone reductase-like Zn-dependent oxidoreductase